jgi:hypothetical protein
MNIKNLAKFSCLTALYFSISGCFSSNNELKEKQEKYKATIQVSTPSGVFQASRNVKKYYYLSFGYINGKSIKTGFVGQAIPVDLPNGKTIFMTYENYSSFQNEIPIPWTRDFQIIKGKKVFVVEKERYPIIVLFKDLDDPSSAIEVLPGNESETLGKGYAIKKIYFEETNDEPNGDIMSRLPWLKNLESNLDGKNIVNSKTPSNYLSRPAFIRKG